MDMLMGLDLVVLEEVSLCPYDSKLSLLCPYLLLRGHLSSICNIQPLLVS
jgi:hypothetical protein